MAFSNWPKDEIQYHLDDLFEQIDEKDAEICKAFEANENEGCTWEDMLFAKKTNSEVAKLQRQRAELVSEVARLQRSLREGR